MSDEQSRVFEGMMNGSGFKFGIVVSRFNAFITEKLLEGALDTLRRHGADLAGVDVAWVPGTFEMPLVARRMAKSGDYHAVICLGAVIRGGTPHFDYVANQAAKGTAEAGMDADLPVIFGVLTCETIEQAIERAGTKAGNMGFKAAQSAIEMVNLYAKLPKSK